MTHQAKQMRFCEGPVRHSQRETVGFEEQMKEAFWVDSVDAWKAPGGRAFRSRTRRPKPPSSRLQHDHAEGNRADDARGRGQRTCRRRSGRDCGWAAIKGLVLFRCQTTSGALVNVNPILANLGSRLNPHGPVVGMWSTANGYFDSLFRAMFC